MEPLVEFRSFSKIARLNRDCIVTEKIDGTNGLVYVTEDRGGVIAGSRERWLTAENDNFGFARWVQEHAQELTELGPGYHYGEWWGAGIQRRYGLTEKRFSLFNVSRWSDDEKRAGCVKCSLVAATWAPATCERCGIVRPPEPSRRPACCGVVPVLARGDIRIATDYALRLLATDGSFAAPGFMRPEGVVVWHSASGQLFKVTLEKDEERKGGQR